MRVPLGSVWKGGSAVSESSDHVLEYLISSLSVVYIRDVRSQRLCSWVLLAVFGVWGCGGR